MTEIWRTSWRNNLHPQFHEHDTEPNALAHEAELRRQGVQHVVVYPLIVQP